MTLTPPDSLGDRFTEAERAEIATVRFRLGGETDANPLQILMAWAYHVVRTDADLTRDYADPMVWGAHDLVAAISMREFLVESCQELTATLRRKVEQVAAEYDDHFRTITEPDTERLIEKVADMSVEGRNWWWHRIPRTGPMLQDLDIYR